MIKALLIDLSGVLYVGNDVVPGAVEAIARVQKSDLALRFVTNTSRKTSSQILADLAAYGFDVRADQLFTATDAAKSWLLDSGLRPWCLVHENIREEFDELDQADPNAVLLGDAAEDFTYANLNRAFQLCLGGAPLIAIGYNRYFKLGELMLLDAGPFVRAIEFAASTEAVIVGKPSGDFFQQVLASIPVPADEAIMIGDDVYGDVEGALQAGLSGCLVRTGKYQPGDEDKIDGEFAVVDAIVEAVELALQES